ncbi:hypothetical protein BES34_011075 [Leptospira inadai serovar Lyme]|uniref:Secreted protein n=1 Tax=Leptospira inadai serovar Lyme TaxID=293084 RepID=A0ABX4YHS6_9LEPT|nr:hypothetical protein BES34_011075 [Leptospira inadai serovar Lyme]
MRRVFTLLCLQSAAAFPMPRFFSPQGGDPYKVVIDKSKCSEELFLKSLFLAMPFSAFMTRLTKRSLTMAIKES